MEYQEAHQAINQLKSLFPHHPIINLMEAFNVSWKEMPFNFDDSVFLHHRENLEAIIAQADSIRELNDEDVEGIFFALAGHSLIAQYYAEEGSYIRALRSARKAYLLIKRGFSKIDEYPEFYFSSGLYNYYREKYSENHPIYRPVMWFFKHGNKKLGLQQLEIATQNSLLSRVEAATYLTYIYIRYENRPELAVPFIRALTAEFPHNIYFQALYGEALALSGDFTTLQPMADSLSSLDKDFYQIAGYLFQGLIQENQGQLIGAQQYFSQGIELCLQQERTYRNYLSLCYAGLARTQHQLGRGDNARKSYKLALKYADYERTIDEAKAYLRK